MKRFHDVKYIPYSNQIFFGYKFFTMYNRIINLLFLKFIIFNIVVFVILSIILITCTRYCTTFLKMLARYVHQAYSTLATLQIERQRSGFLAHARLSMASRNSNKQSRTPEPPSSLKNKNKESQQRKAKKKSRGRDSRSRCQVITLMERTRGRPFLPRYTR